MIKINEILSLKNINPEPGVSIYIPTEITGDYEKNRIRWKNACQKALSKLESITNIADKIMKPAFDLAQDSRFWAYQTNGLAAFIDSGSFQLFHLSKKVPEFVHVHDHFYLNPLFNELGIGTRIFVLALSQNEVNFYEAVEDGIFPVFIDDVVAKDMQEALNIDDFNDTLQFRTIGGGKSLFHSSGIADNSSDEYLNTYFRRIDDGLMQIIHDETAPLVIAGVEEYHQIYNSITNYNNFSNHFIKGNPKDLSPKDLRRNLQPLFDEISATPKSNFRRNFELKRSAGLGIEKLEDILFMARNKNVDSLLISEDYRNHLLITDPEILEELFFLLHYQGTEIYVDQSEEQKISAILRFEMQTTS